MRGGTPRALWILAGAGLLLRLPLFIQHLASPFARQLLLDANNYWEWSGRIAAGSLLPSSPFHQGPLYPYLLGGARAVFPALTPDGVAAAQLLMNWLSCLLFFPLIRRGGGERAALAAVAAALLFAPAAFFALKLFTVTLSLLLFQFALLLLLRGEPGPAPGASGGVLLGLACLSTPSFLPAALAAALFPALRRRPAARVAGSPNLAALLAPLLGLMIAVAPAVAVNLATGGGPAFVTSTGLNLYLGNHKGAQGTYSVIAGAFPDIARGETDFAGLALSERGTRLSPGEVSRAYLGKAFSFITGNPGDFLALLGKKVLMTAGGQDIMLEHSLPRERRDFLPWLWAFPLTGTAVLLLAAASLGSLGRQAGEVRTLALSAAAFAVSPLVFFVANRHVLPFQFYLLPLAATAFLLPRRDLLRPSALAALALVLAGAVYSWSGGRIAGSEADYRANLATAYLKAGRLAEAQDAVVRVLDLRPGQTTDWILIAEISGRQGRIAEAEAALLRARASDPANALPPLRLARLRIKEGRLSEASAFLDEAERANPLDPEVAWYRVNLLLDTGRREEAERAAHRALDAIPASAIPRFSLGRVLAAQGRWLEAREEFLQALAIDPLFYWGLNDLAAAEFALGYRDSARARISRARRQELWVSPVLQEELEKD